MARRARLRFPAFSRLLRLQRDGGRPRTYARRALSRQLRHALPCHRPRRVLATLAHDAVTADPRLSLYPARWQSAWLGDLCEGDARLHGPVWIVARRGLDV